MAYDEELAERIRAQVGAGAGVTEKKMFGGLAFLVGGNMAVAAGSKGGLMVRIDPAESDAVVAASEAEVMVMRGKPMAGWLRVAAEHVATDGELGRWVEMGTSYARSLPAKS